MAVQRRGERRRLCKFLPDWTLSDEFCTWLTPVKGDNHKAYCLLCKKVFAVSHGGLNDVKAHYKGKRHICLQLQRQQQETAEDSSNLWEGHQNFRPKNVGQFLAFNEKTDACEEIAKPNSHSSSIIGEENIGYDSSENGDKYWEFDLAPDAIPTVVADRNTMNSQLKMMPQQYCLRWKYHHNNLQVMFSQLLERESYCDVTIACEGKTIRAHKMVLSACSTYFDAIFSQHEEKNPIVILKDVKYSDIKALVEFMYKGEINVDNSHLTSLLKTAEDLHIKGLAEVSWRSDRSQEAANDSDVIEQGDVINGSDVDQPPHKRRRARLQQPDEDSGFNPLVTSVTGAAGTENAYTVQEDVIQPEEEEMEETVLDDSEPEVISDTEDTDHFLYNQDPLNDSNLPEPERETTQSSAVEESILQRISAQYQDVVKLNDYLTTGRRQQFWEEPFTRRVMEAIKGKELEMKVGAELLGVSYGTLYGRYRDAYGCLKHPYRVRDFWSESGPADILAKVQRKEITLFRAAEMLNVTVTTLANYLSTLRQPGLNTSFEDNDVKSALRDDDDGGQDELDDELEEEPKTINDSNTTTVKQEPLTNHEHKDTPLPPQPLHANNNKDQSECSDNEEMNGTDNEITGSPR